MCGDNASLSEKISDLSMIYYTYDSMLAENELKDSLTDISEAAAIAEINDYFKIQLFLMNSRALRVMNTSLLKRL